jgi:hypothetical protein
MLMSSLSCARSAREALVIPHGSAANGLCESQVPRTLLVSPDPEAGTRVGAVALTFPGRSEHVTQSRIRGIKFGETGYSQCSEQIIIGPACSPRTNPVSAARPPSFGLLGMGFGSNFGIGVSLKPSEIGENGWVRVP